MMTAREMINMALDKFDGKLDETHKPGHWFARFVHTMLQPGQLPTRSKYHSKVEDGFQVLDPDTAIHILMSGKHRTDDWFRESKYPYLAFLKAKKTSGSLLSYPIVKPEDVQELWVANVRDLSGELSIEVMERGDAESWGDVDPDDVVELKDDMGEKRFVQAYFKRTRPDFIDTLAT